MRHGEDSTYEALVDRRRTFNARTVARGVLPEAEHAIAEDMLRSRLLFPELIDRPLDYMSAEDMPSVERTQAALTDICGHMVGARDTDDLSDTPAAFTYFGQFAFHDVVFSRVFGKPGSYSARNATSLSLDLSGLYGRGPIVDAHLYDSASAVDSTPCRFPMGLPSVADATVFHAVDGSIERARDLPRIDAGGSFMSVCGRTRPYRPLIADPRNDDNLILSQLVCALMQAHNRLVDLQVRELAVPPPAAFERARSYLTAAYRHVVVDDYLRRIMAPAVWDHFFGADGFRGPGLAGLGALHDLPLEFSFGASRFAHSMVRSRYRINETLGDDQGKLRQVLDISTQRAQGKVPVRVNWAVDWSGFARTGDAGNVQRARRVSPLLAFDMAMINHSVDLDDVPRSIAFMDCWRCYHLGLPSGQAVAAAVARRLSATAAAVPVLSGERMLPTQKCKQRYNAANDLAAALLRHPQFLTETPLSYYVLQEASVLGDDGSRLGPVGSYIVGATCASALFKTNDGETPLGFDGAVEPRDLAGLLKLADDRLTSNEQLRQNLARTVHPDLSARGHRRTGDIVT